MEARVLNNLLYLSEEDVTIKFCKSESEGQKQSFADILQNRYS